MNLLNERVKNMFCPNCGEKQTQEPAREVEVLEDLENKEVEKNALSEIKTILDQRN